MHQIEAGILESFRREPSREFTTSDLVRDIFPQKFSELNRLLHIPEKRAVRKGYALKAKLHRKLLYHVNRLVDRGLLDVAGVQGKGEKLFRLAMDEGEIVVESKEKRIVITKQAAVVTPVDGYEQEGFIRKYRPGTWLTKHDAILFDGPAFDGLTGLQRRLQGAFPHVSDVLAIDRFEHFLKDATPEEGARFMEYLALDAHDYDVAVAILINVTALESEETLLRLFRAVLGKLPNHISFSFAVTSRLLAKREAFFKELFTIFLEAKRKLTLRNSALHAPPIFFGRAGPYTFTAADWEQYRTKTREVADGCVVGQNSLVVDITRYFQENGTVVGFREMLIRAAHALFEVDEQRRKRALDPGPFPGPAAKEAFRTGRNYVRFWNYDWAETERYPLIDLLGSVQEEIAKFCATQETIFKSCGLPIRFRIGLSTSFAKFDQDFFSERRYKKTVISSVKDLQTKDLRHYLQIRERLFKTFEGADRLRFFFARGTPVADLHPLARYLLSAHDLPCFTFDFRGKSGELKLTSFLEVP